MNASEYRAEYAAFSRAHEQERHRLYVRGHDAAPATPELRRIAERYADLHTPAAADELKRILDATPAHLETERTGLRRLVEHARLGSIKLSALDAEADLRDCLARRRINFGGEVLPLESVPARIADEADADARRELLARWLDELPACDDSRHALRRARNEAAAIFGQASDEAAPRDLSDSSDLFTLSASSTAFADAATPLASLAQTYLDRTAAAYRQRLPGYLARVQPGTDTSRATYADSLRFEQLPNLARLFPARMAVKTYRSALDSLKLRSTVEPTTRPAVKENRTIQTRHAAAFAFAPPTEVRLEARVTNASDGTSLYRDLLLAAGRAQHFAWSSADLLARHPEFVCPSDDRGTTDDATRAAHAHFFTLFLRDPRWLGEHRELSAADARGVARDAEFVEIFRLRRAAGRVVTQADFARRKFDRDEEIQEEYAALMSDATGFVYDPRLQSADALDGEEPEIELRAALFAYALLDHLRTRYGSGWWARTGARDALIDLWNTGTRYAPEELARLSTGGAPDAEVLAAAHLAAMNGGEE